MQLALLPEDTSLPPGVAIFRGRIDRAEQVALLDSVADIIAAAPLYRPRMRNGTPLINRMTNCGPLGWLSDEKGYRYVDRHPETGTTWPPIPPALRRLADALAQELGIRGYAPDACLVNAYAGDGRLNLHTDHDEADFRWPIVSVSLGAEAVFQIGGLARKDRVSETVLASGDVVVLHGPSRARFHGVKRIRKGTAPFRHPVLGDIARINLTLRQAR